MTTVTAFTAERMLEIENGTVVNGTISGDNLVLVKKDGSQIVAGSLRGPQGVPGPTGDVSTAQLDAAIAATIALVQGAGAVQTAMIAVGAIVTDRIANGAVTTPKIADGNVTTAKLGDGSVTTAKLGDGQVTGSKLANGAVFSDKIADDGVTRNKIADGAVNGEHYANGSIQAAHVGFMFQQSTAPPVVAGGWWIQT